MSKQKSRKPSAVPLVPSRNAAVPAVSSPPSFEVQQRLYQTFEPMPLEASETDLYVDLDSVRGDTDVVEKLLREIQFSKKPKTWLLSGHKGCGKSTELRRLKHRLETGPNKYFTVLCTERHVDTVNVEFTDVLIVTLQQVAAELKKIKISLESSYLTKTLQNLSKLLFSEVKLEKLEFSAGWAKISSAIQSSPDAREQVRNLLEAETANLQREVNQRFDKANEELAKQGYAGLLVLFDSLDRIIDVARAEALFVQRATEMTAFRCKMVMTMPISLAYSESIQQLSTTYASKPNIVPMTKLRTPPPARARHEPGFEKFREIVDARLKKVGESRSTLFQSDQVLDELIAATGGQPTELMAFLQALIVKGPLPISSEGVARLRREFARDYRWFVREDWKVLSAIAKDGRYELEAQSQSVLKRLLDSRAVLQYLNDEEWYDLNPIVEQITPPSSEKSSE